jgi:hypothetical protein
MSLLYSKCTCDQIKYYLEGSGKDSAVVEELLPRVVLELGEAWLEVKRHGLWMASA